MKVLITGGLGFIGANFVRYFLGKYKDSEIYCLDKLTYAANRSLLNTFKHFSTFHFIKGDISNLSFMKKVFSKHKFDYVINFAAETSVDKSFIDPALFYESNVIGVVNLASLSLKYGVKRFHQVGTDEVYGDLELDSDYKFKETDKLNPLNPYALTKANADEFLLMYHKLTGLDLTISRCTNNFGPYQAQDKLIPLVINRALMDQEIPIFGSGKNVRDWINVLDHCKAIDLILFNGKAGEIYNVSSHYPLTNLEVTKKILKKLNKDKSLIKFVNDRRIHDKKYAIDTTKIENELGFKSEFDFDFSLDATIEYYKEI